MKFLINAVKNKNKNILFQNMNNLPAELCDIIKSFVSNVVYINLNKENYFKYHYMFHNLINKRQLETYISTMIRQDNDFMCVQ